jgi:hypothetical protein
MKTAPLVVAVVTVTILPVVLSSFGCNKKEDAAPVPSATALVAAPPPSTAAPSATPLLPTQPTIPLMKTVGPRTDAGAGAKSDAAVAVARADAAAVPTVGLPPGLPTVALPHPSALPGLASSIVGGIIQHLPPPIIPPPTSSQ